MEYVARAPALIGLSIKILSTKEGGADRGCAVRAQGAHGNSREDKYEAMTLALVLLPPRAHQTAVPI